MNIENNRVGGKDTTSLNKFDTVHFTFASFSDREVA